MGKKERQAKEALQRALDVPNDDSIKNLGPMTMIVAPFLLARI